jgi:hypothetical protein
MTTGPPQQRVATPQFFMILPDEYLSLVRLFTHVAETRADEYDAPHVYCFCPLAPG